MEVDEDSKEEAGGDDDDADDDCWMIVKETCLFDEMVQFVQNCGGAAACCLLQWILKCGCFKDGIVVDSHIFQHTPAETGTEFCLHAVLHLSHGLKQLHSRGSKMQ